MIENNRIVFLTLSLCKGGAENQLVKLSIFFKQRGFDVAIINVLPQNDFKEDLLIYEIENHYFNVRSFSGFIKLLKYVSKSGPDLLISFMYGANLIARFLKLVYKFPIITSVRRRDISKIYAHLYRISYKIDDVTTFNSEYALNLFVKNHWTDPAKSVFMKNAVHIEEEHYKEESKNKIPYRLVSIAHFRPDKDYITLFKALQILNNLGEKVELNILGHTFGSKWPENKIEELDISQIVNVLGFINNNKEYLRDADALILSSYGEGSPNAILEAMANKTPVIASNVPGCSTLINESGCGLLFECGDADDLAKKIIELKNLSVPLKVELGNKGYDYVRENYDENIVLEKWFTIVNDILSIR